MTCIFLVSGRHLGLSMAMGSSGNGNAKAPAFSLSLNSKSASKPPSSGFPQPATTIGKRPRAFAGDEDEDEQEHAHEQITSFGGDEAVKQPIQRVIEPLADTRAWGSRAKRQKSSLPVTEQPSADAPAPQEPAEPKFGLQLASRTRTSSNSPPAEPSTTAQPARTEDDEALARLTGQTDGPQASITIATEDEAFDRDVAAASTNPTLDDYSAVPIDGFGAALMRGYLPTGETIESWKTKAATKARASGGSKRIDKDGNVVVQRRAELLGLGAKELDLGVDKSKEKKKPRRQAMEYEPLARRNVKTGQIISEAEYVENVERQGAAESGKGSNGSRRGDDNDERRHRDNDSGRERESDRQREHGRDRERRRDDERRDRDRDRDRESKRRDKERDYDGRRDRRRDDHDDHSARRRRDDRDGDRRHRDERGSDRRHRDERDDDRRQRDRDRDSHRERERRREHR